MLERHALWRRGGPGGRHRRGRHVRTAEELLPGARSVIVIGYHYPFSNLLRAIGRQRIDLYCMAGSLAINIALTALLIPSLGYLAPAVATVVSHGIYTLLASIVAFPDFRGWMRVLMIHSIPVTAAPRSRRPSDWPWPGI